MLLILILLLAPIPKQQPVIYTAPPPRPMSIWIDIDGTRHNYTREYWDNGILKRRIYEGDPELECVYPILPVRPGIKF